jgi:hypothetical protein
LEAFASELFPVVSDIPANREWIDPKLSNGITATLDDPQSFADSIRLAVENCDLRKRGGKINRELVLTRADARRNTATMASMLESVL